MQKNWTPSLVGRFFTRTPAWNLALSEDAYLLTYGEEKYKDEIAALDKAKSKGGIFWTSVDMPLANGTVLVLDGISNEDAESMMRTVALEVKRIRIEKLIKNFDVGIEPVLTWTVNVRDAVKKQFEEKGWLTEEFKAAQLESKPMGISDLLDEPVVIKHIESQSDKVKGAVHLWRQNFNEVADTANQKYLTNELTQSKPFFDRVEKSPLTEEQAKAVICFDNRVLLVASAGSGKTSTMVAKAGYAIKKGFFSADKILLLAFNKDAAAELRERIKARLLPHGLPAEQVTAKTFHAFGLDVIGEATGKKPSLASWLDNGQDLAVVLQLVDTLKDRDTAFRVKWDLFRVVLGQDLPKFGQEQESPDSWDNDRKTSGFWTMNGEVVKSRGEQLLANWFFYNGVQYQYETKYRIDTADAKHRQYQPDFYFPAIDVYLEHWAVDENGEPPAEFEGYKEGMAWKRDLHLANGTTLLETTMAELWSGKAFTYLEQELTQLGITLDPNPDREGKGRRPMENPRLARTFRSFLTHAKSNRVSINELKQRLDSGVAGHFQYRHKVFLELFEQVWLAWENKLKEERCIDFEDMLNLAADCVEAGMWQSPYELIMVDEFQDVSQARARLIASLLTKSGRHLFAVGDDWQSINRFAGSDLGVMTEFEEKFGKAVTLKLEKTFRCPQSLCDISSGFIQKNPKQLRKRVTSEKIDTQQPVKIIRVDDEYQIPSAISKQIQTLSKEHLPLDKPLKIYVLGRYRRDKDFMPVSSDERVQLEFVTAHSSKGLEADHVIIPRMTAETMGFPSRIEDDPVLQLAMPSEDAFADAEERRLFYVALTRAKKSVTLVTVTHKESPFITELVKDCKIEVGDLAGSIVASEVCPACQKGFLVQRTGRYGLFMGCSRFPRCQGK